MNKKIILILCIVFFLIMFSSSINAIEPRTFVNISLSWDNSTTLTDEISEGFIFNFRDSFNFYGGSADDWGHTWIKNETKDELNTTNFRARLKYSHTESAGLDPQMDHIKIRIYYNPPIPAPRFIDPTPADNADIGTTLRINVTNDEGSDFLNCKLEHNITGTFVNESMTAEGIYCYLTKTQIDNATEFSFQFYGDLGSTENSTEIRNVRVNNLDIPLLNLTNPPNNTDFYDVGNIILNFTINDSQDDLMEFWIYGGNSSQNNFEQLIYYEKDIPSGSYSYNWTVPFIPTDSEDLYAYYHFDNRSEFGEDDDYIYDFSGNNRNGTVQVDNNYVINNSGYFGRVFEMDPTFGDEIGIKIGEGTEFNDICLNGCTFAAWVNHDLDSGVTIVSKYDSYDEPVDDNKFFWFRIKEVYPNKSVLEFRIYDDGSSNVCIADDTETLIPKGEWHHATGVYNISDIMIYIDGEFVNKTACSLTINHTSWSTIGQDTVIGAAFIVEPDMGYSWDGKLDEVAIWNRSLTNNEIANIYELDRGTYYWNVTVQDQASYKNYSETWLFNIVSTCTYISGDWGIDWADNCTLVNQDITLCDGCNLSVTEITDTGFFLMDNSTIRNIHQRLISGGIEFIRKNGARLLFGH